MPETIIGVVAIEGVFVKDVPQPKVRTVLVVGGSPDRPGPALVGGLARLADAVVACDAGIDVCRAAGVAVTAAVGDWDSADPATVAWARAAGVPLESHPPAKDDADLSLAVDRARGFREEGDAALRLVLTGVSGGRLDHGLAAIGCMLRAADLQPVVEEETFAAMLLDRDRGRSEWRFRAEDVGRTVGVMALADGAVVSETGMRWNLDRRALRLFDDLAVSNVVESPGAMVRVHEGAVLVVAQRLG